MTINDIKDDLEILHQATPWVIQAGGIALEHFGHVTVTRKADRSPVTEADLAVQESLQAAISHAYPSDAVLAEETQEDPQRHASRASAKRCWIIDPIDGTRNYARSLPIFTLSVALFVDGRPRVGMIYDPMTSRMYSAVAGGGAWCNEHKLTLQSRSSASDFFLSVPTSQHEELPPVVHSWIDRMVVRNYGSTALHLALLASGGLDGVFCKRCRLWDIAAGMLIVSEAGGELRSIDGDSYLPMNVADYNNQTMPFIAGSPEAVEMLQREYQTG